MDFVLDCSIAASFLLPDEQDPAAIEILDAFEKKQAVVPVLFFWEVGNVLNVVLKRQRATRETIREIIKNLQALPIHIDSAPNIFELNELLTIAAKHNLSAYDAAYLRTAQKFSVPLITLDKALAMAAGKEGIAGKINDSTSLGS